jgi:hypothetical protein
VRLNLPQHGPRIARPWILERADATGLVWAARRSISDDDVELPVTVEVADRRARIHRGRERHRKSGRFDPGSGGALVEQMKPAAVDGIVGAALCAEDDRADTAGRETEVHHQGV